MRWLAILLVIVLVAGCAQKKGDTSTATESAPSHETGDPLPPGITLVQPPPPKPHPYELFGVNVSYAGSLDLSFELDVPANATYLFVTWYAANDTSGNEVLGDLTMDGCPDDQRVGASGGSVGNSWCNEPPVGHHAGRYQMYVGQLTGRFCILNVPQHSQGSVNCKWSPYAH